MNLTLNDDILQSAKDRLISFFRSKENLLALLESYTSENQEIEQGLYDTWGGFDPLTAEGAQLDAIGAVVGEARQSRDDDTYRLFIRARVLINQSSGRINEIIDIFQLLGGTGTITTLTQTPPASFVFFFAPGPTFPLDVDSYKILLNSLTPAGVGSQLHYSTETTGLFTLSSQSGTLETSTTEGLADAGQTTGGILTGVI